MVAVLRRSLGERCLFAVAMVRMDTLKKERTRRPHPSLWEGKYSTVEVSNERLRVIFYVISEQLVVKCDDHFCVCGDIGTWLISP